jgi:hypothetical protein
MDHIDVTQWEANLLAGSLPGTVMLNPGGRIKRGIIGAMINLYDLEIK